MTSAVSEFKQDVMQVCRNGHVVTNQMRTCPEQSRSHCERCGVTTLHACSTCGQELAGAIVVPGLQPVGTPRPPQFCSMCGAAFPWHGRPGQVKATAAINTLETFLRRLPLVVRQFRGRWSTRPPFCVEDEHDLEDLVRALLPLFFDNVRLRSRTPTYAPDTRTDFLLYQEKIVLTLKRTSADQTQSFLERQLQEDKAFYRIVTDCRMLWVYVNDPQGHLQEPPILETVWSQGEDGPPLRCVIS
jgi:hypothetical protein